MSRRSRGYARIFDPALAKPIERDTMTCGHCNAVVHMHDLNGTPLSGVLVHCHGCDRHVCVRCAETPKCVPLEKRLEAMEARERLRRAP